MPPTRVLPTRMLPTQRRQAILAEVRKANAVSAEDLARMFGVSLETIRRDLRGLRDQGLLERVYGGALSVQSTEGDLRHPERPARRRASRPSPRLAATLVEPEDTIVIDIGTTALEVARALPADFRGRVLTNSVPAAMELADRDGDRAAAVRRAGPARRRGLLRRAGRGLLRRVLRRQGVPRLRRRARPGRADRLPPARGGHPAHDHRARGRLLRPGRLEQARHDRRAPGLPAEPASPRSSPIHQARPEAAEALAEAAGCTVNCAERPTNPPKGK